MISLSSIALATALAAGAAEAAVTPCRDVSRGTRGFGLALDWERVSRPDPRAGSLFRTVSGSDRTAELDCVLTATVLPARAVSERVLPESSSGSSERGSAWLPPFSFFVSATGVYDSNINHDEKPVRDYGTVFGVGTRFETDALEVEYELASHTYKNTDRWDRISHSLTSSYQQKFSRKLSMEAVGEIALKGFSEDRELGDQYIFEPRLHYRISPSSRLRLYAPIGCGATTRTPSATPITSSPVWSCGGAWEGQRSTSATAGRRTARKDRASHTIDRPTAPSSPHLSPAASTGWEWSSGIGRSSIRTASSTTMKTKAFGGTRGGSFP